MKYAHPIKIGIAFHRASKANYNELPEITINQTFHLSLPAMPAKKLEGNPAPCGDFNPSNQKLILPIPIIIGTNCQLFLNT